MPSGSKVQGHQFGIAARLSEMTCEIGLTEAATKQYANMENYWLDDRARRATATVGPIPSIRRPSDEARKTTETSSQASSSSSPSPASLVRKEEDPSLHWFRSYPDLAIHLIRLVGFTSSNISQLIYIRPWFDSAPPRRPSACWPPDRDRSTPSWPLSPELQFRPLPATSRPAARCTTRSGTTTS